MSSSRLRVDTVKIKDLYDFACRFIDGADGQDIVPITKQLALSHSKNPYADPEDVALLVAYVGDRCVGHQGLLPVRVTSPRGSGTAFWCTGLYVLPEFRNRLVAVRFVHKLLVMNQDYVINKFAKRAGQLFAAMHFRKIPPLEYFRLRVDRLDVLGIPFWLMTHLNKWPILRAVGRTGLKLSRVVSFGFVNAMYYRLLMRRGRTALARYTLVEVDHVRPLENTPATARGTRFLRDVDAVNWTLQYPWLSDRGAPTAPPYFSGEKRDTFRNIAVEILGPQRAYHGFLFLTVVESEQRTEVKLRDFQTTSPVDEKIVFWVASEYARRHHAHSLELPGALASALDAVPLKSLLVQRSQRQYLFHPKESRSILATFADDAHLNLSDGDTAFV